MQFGTGNRRTLFDLPKAQGRDVRQALLDFYHKVSKGRGRDGAGGQVGGCNPADLPPWVVWCGVVLSGIHQYYLAPRMTLVVVAAEPLDQMQRWADSLFAKVGHAWHSLRRPTMSTLGLTHPSVLLAVAPPPCRCLRGPSTSGSWSRGRAGRRPWRPRRSAGSCRWCRCRT